jgi:hypothetical protein
MMKTEYIILLVNEWWIYFLTSFVLLGGSIFSNFISEEPVYRSRKISVIYAIITTATIEITVTAVAYFFGVENILGESYALIMAVPLILLGICVSHPLIHVISRIFADE